MAHLLSSWGINMPQKWGLFPNYSKPHRWRKSGKGLMMRTKACFQMRLPMPTPSACWTSMYGTRMDAQVRKGLDDEDKVLFVNVVGQRQPASACWTSMFRTHIDGASQEKAWWFGQDKVLFVNMFANANLPWPVEECWEVWGTCAIYVGIPSLILANEWDLRHLCPLSQPVAEL